MKRFLKGYRSVVLLVMLAACSTDGIEENNAQSREFPNFIVIGQNADNVYEFNYTSSSDTGETINLTQEAGIKIQYITLRQTGELLTFYSFLDGNFSAIQRNITTGEIQFFPNFYTVDDKRSILWGVNSEEKIFLGFYSPRGTSNLNLLAIDPKLGTQIDIFLENDVQQSFFPLYHSGKLFLTLLDTSNKYSVFVIDAANNSIIERLDFGDSKPSLAIDNAGNVAIIEGGSGANSVLSTYDFDTLEKLEGLQFSLGRSFKAGVLEAEIYDNTLFYTHLFGQPSPITFGPAFYDFTTGENSIINMISIVSTFEQQNQVNIELISWGFDSATENYLIGYGITGPGIAMLEGGVLVISLDGNLIQEISLPFAPTYFVN